MLSVVQKHIHTFILKGCIQEYDGNMWIYKIHETINYYYCYCVHSLVVKGDEKCIEHDNILMRIKKCMTKLISIMAP